MSKGELKIAARLMRMAAEEFSNHGCNDIEDSLFDGVRVFEKFDLESTANQINGSAEDPIPIENFGDDGLMRIMATLLDAAAERAR